MRLAIRRLQNYLQDCVRPRGVRVCAGRANLTAIQALFNDSKQVLNCVYLLLINAINLNHVVLVLQRP